MKLNIILFQDEDETRHFLTKPRQRRRLANHTKIKSNTETMHARRDHIHQNQHRTFISKIQKKCFLHEFVEHFYSIIIALKTILSLLNNIISLKIKPKF